MCHILENEEVVAAPDGDIDTIVLLQEVERLKLEVHKGGEDFQMIASLVETAGTVVSTKITSMMRINAHQERKV